MTALIVSETEISAWVMSWLWPFFRVAALVMTAPVIGTKSVPLRMRLVLALALSLVVAPLAGLRGMPEPVSALGLLITVQQILVGAALGLAVRLVFLVMEVGGQVIAQQTGLGFAAMMDPMNGAQVPVVSQFYIVLGTLTFFSIDGHLVLIEVLAESFKTVPVLGPGLARESLWQITGWVSWLLSQAVVLALPAMIALLVVNLALAVVARAAPQLNIISVGFPFMILFGMFVVLYTAHAMEPFFLQLFDDTFRLARTFLAGP